MLTNRDLSALIIDENTKFRNEFKTKLGSYGYLVDQATSGFHGLTLLEQKEEESKPYDIVVLEMNMSEMPGFEVLSLIRDRYRLTQLPIIACTKNASAEDQEEFMVQGASSYLDKSVGMQIFLDSIKFELNNILTRKNR